MALATTQKYAVNSHSWNALVSSIIENPSQIRISDKGNLLTYVILLGR